MPPVGIADDLDKVVGVGVPEKALDVLKRPACEPMAMEEPGQLSPKVRTGMSTSLLQFPGLLLTDILEGQVMVGFWLSVTVTLKLQVAVLAGVAPSETVQRILVMPLLKTAPFSVEGMVAMVAPVRL